MLKTVKDFLKEEDGLGTVELVLIIAVLVGLALLFRNQIVAFVTKIMGGFMGKDVGVDSIENQPVPNSPVHN